MATVVAGFHWTGPATLSPVIGPVRWSTPVDSAPALRRWPVVAISAMVIASFGPYLVGGIRTEQAVVYSLLLVGAAGLWWRRGRLDPAVLALTVLFVSQLALASLGAYSPPSTLARYQVGNSVAGIDNLLLPGAVIITVSWLTYWHDSETLLRRVSTLIIACACINAALAMWSVVVDTQPYLSMFWTEGGTAGAPSTAKNAVTMSRYSGVFNQPAEGGQFYGIALLAVIYRCRTSPVVLSLATAIICIGGALTVSKIFLLVGLPVGAWQAFSVPGGRRKRWITLGATATALIFCITAGILPQWAGGDYLARLLDPSGGGKGGVYLYSAGRFGEGSTLQPVIDAVMQISPWFGFGAGGLSVPYDNGWIESLVVAGVPGLILYTLIVAVLLVAWLRRRATLGDSWSAFFGGLILVLVGASLGVPAMTANRSGTLFWIVITLLLCIKQEHLVSANADDRVEPLVHQPMTA